MTLELAIRHALDDIDFEIGPPGADADELFSP